MKNDVRQKYLDFFEKRGHKVVPSSRLVPDGDPTTLFTGSGMQPMMPYLLGDPHPEGNRIVDSQKCFRSVDIEEVGDNRHTTFFEMLGNWSLGDYFKKEQLTWFFEFITKEVGLDPQKLYVTVFSGQESIGIPKDEEAVEIWQKLFQEEDIEAKAVDNGEEAGLQGGRIFYYPAEKNWWSRAGKPELMPIGEPGGPDSEVFYDFGESLKLHENSEFAELPCHPNCDCGRFLEIGNSVFMTYKKTNHGFEPLEQKNIDFGGGLERILAAVNNDPDVFTTPLFSPIISFLETIADTKYQDSEQASRSYRVIADHAKAAVMLAADGVYPSNKEQGYFSRRLVRRAVRYAKMIGINQPFLADLTKIVAEIYQDQYPEVSNQSESIAQVLSQEELKFERTLQRGLKEVEKLLKNQQMLTGKDAFKLFETYGFPVELTQEIAQEKGHDIDLSEFEEAKSEHAKSSKTSSAGKFKGGLADHSEETTRYHTATHLLHAALRKVLGSSVEQKGSNITANRLRFDFTHPTAMTAEEKNKVEQLVNDWIIQDLPVSNTTVPYQQAIDEGALAFFGEKYPEQVSVYTIGQDPEGSKNKGWISKELCGGPHVKSTGEIGPVEIFKEKAVSAGVRRVYMKSKTV